MELYPEMCPENGFAIRFNDEVVAAYTYLNSSMSGIDIRRYRSNQAITDCYHGTHTLIETDVDNPLAEIRNHQFEAMFHCNNGRGSWSNGGRGIYVVPIVIRLWCPAVDVAKWIIDRVYAGRYCLQYHAPVPLEQTYWLEDCVYAELYVIARWVNKDHDNLPINQITKEMKQYLVDRFVSKYDNYYSSFFIDNTKYVAHTEEGVDLHWGKDRYKYNRVVKVNRYRKDRNV